MAGAEILNFIQALAKIPGLGPRSGKRAALHLIENRTTQLINLRQTIDQVLDHVTTCQTCGNIDTQQPCSICCEVNRDLSTLCIVEHVADLWAMERSGTFRGHYHVLGGVLSALEGVGPSELHIDGLLKRLGGTSPIREIVLALSATIEGQTTAHYLKDTLAPYNISISAIAHGIPLGAELDYLDDGTLVAAMAARKAV